jgi:hypothetical protein
MCSSSHSHYKKDGSEFLQICEIFNVLKTATMAHKPIYAYIEQPFVIMFMGSW